MATDERSSKWFRGEGGDILKLDVPLPPEMADQVRLGKLVEVPAPAEDTPEPVAAVGQRVAAIEPSTTDSKSAWVDYAIAHGMSRIEANAASRTELIEKFSTTGKAPHDTTHR